MKIEDLTVSIRALEGLERNVRQLILEVLERGDYEIVRKLVAVAECSAVISRAVQNLEEALAQINEEERKKIFTLLREEKEEGVGVVSQLPKKVAHLSMHRLAEIMRELKNKLGDEVVDKTQAKQLTVQAKESGINISQQQIAQARALRTQGKISF